MNYRTLDYNQIVNLMPSDYVHFEGVAIDHTPALGFLIQPHAIDGYTTSVLKSGWLEGEINGIAYHIEAPAIIFIPHLQIIEETRRSTNLASTRIFLSNEFVDTLHIPDMKTQDDVILHIPYYPLTNEQLIHATQILARIEEAIHSDIKYKEQYIRALVGVWVFDDDLQRFHSEISDDTENDVRVALFLQEVKKSALEQSRLQYYADLVHISGSQLERIVHRQTGKTVLNWINFYRVEYCKKRLSENANLTQLAYELKFSSAEYLCRFFRQQTGRSPKEYKLFIGRE